MSATQRISRHLAGRLSAFRTAGGRGFGERGATAVEFALVLPLLVMMVFGIIDFGRAYNAQLTLSQAARVGARQAALGNSSGACTAIASAAATLNISCPSSAVTVVTCPSGADQTSSGTATITYVYTLNDPISAYVGKPSFTITGKAAMPCGG